LKGFSVGFIPLDFDEKTKVHKKISLIEISAVPVPANENALIMEAYKDGKITTKGLIEDFEIDETGSEEDEEIEIETEPYNFTKDEKAEIAYRVEKGKKAIKKLRKKKEVSPPGENKDIIEIENEEEFKDWPTEYEILEALNKEEEIITKPEVTENYIRIPVSPGHDGHRIRTITISASQGIKALYCGECKKVITYLFDKSKWTMERAQAWIREHKRGLDRYERILGNKEKMPGDMAVEQIIEKEEPANKLEMKIGLKPEIIEYFEDRLDEIRMGIEKQIIELKEGRVLSTKNRTLVKDIMDKLGDLKEKLEELYNATEPPAREEEKEIEIEEPEINIDKDGDKIDINIDHVDGDDITQKAKTQSKIEIDVKKLAREIYQEKLDKAKGKIG